jgi:hypothetical protein
MLSVLLASSSAALAAPKPATAPVDPLLVDAKKAVADNKIDELASKLEEPLRAALTDLNSTDLDRVTQLVALREFSTSFAKSATADDRTAKTLLWLLDSPDLLKTLMMAVTKEDSADRVLVVLDALRKEEPKRADEFADLATALCVVWDTPASADREQPRADPDRPVWLLRYFANARGKLRFDAKQMPWQLAVYVADLAVTPEEVMWAARRYASRGAIGAAYFDVPYDREAYYGTVEKMINARAYTLENLTRYGGICSDQAYFATAVARSIGVPAAVCTGQGEGVTDSAHAWVGYLDVRGKQVRWNFSEGRYAEMNFWRGNVQDPQTRKQITDSDVAMLAELATTEPKHRLASIALCKAHVLVGDDKLMALYTRAINLSPGNRTAWEALAQLGADRKLTTAQIAQVTDVVAQFAAKQYPDFAFDVLVRLNAGRGTADRIKALDQSRKLFASRPDLLAQIRIEQGNLMRQEKRYDEALAAYAQVLTANRTAGPILLRTLAEIETTLRETRDLPRLAGIYQQAWQAMPQPTPGAYVRSTPYYLIGLKYCTILRELGDERQVQQAQIRLDAMDTSATKRMR